MRYVYLSLGLICTTSISAKEPTAQQIDFFEKKIRPVLVQQCYRCHSSKATRLKGGLRLDTRAGLRKGGATGLAIVPGQAKKSLLLRALRHEEMAMPPGKKLPNEVIADFEKWVQMGAPDPRTKNVATPTTRPEKHWAFLPLKAAGIPAPDPKHESYDPLDQFILRKLSDNGLTPNGEASRATWLRRVTFDLIGLPPTIQELEQFLADDSPHAHERVVDRLLSSPHFGPRWGRHWLDVARFAESAGQSRNISYRFAWRYRNWVFDAFNEDRPYDRFILEQLAGDLLPAKTQDQRDHQTMGTGFLVVGPKLLNEGNTSLTYRMGVVDDQIDTTFRGFLALTVGCARCHDHKYDPIPTREYYSLAGIFRSTENLAGVESNNNTIDSGLYPLGEGGEKILEEIKEKKERFLKETQEFVKARRERQSLEAKLEGLKKKKAEAKEIADLEAKIQEALKVERALQAKRLKTRKDTPPPPPSTMGVREAKKIADCELFLRGDVQKPSKAVPRGTLQILEGVCPEEKIGPKESGRLQLANWITNRRNPLTARVMVNRIWQHLFGAGLVTTVDNFGTLGHKPSHPELLDYLALRFMNEGWSTKRLIRAIVLSRTYRRSSAHNEKAYAKDPDNRLLWRMNRRRLEGEAIRDALLAVSGQLNEAPLEGSVISKIGMFEMNPTYQKQLSESYLGASYRSAYLPAMRAGVPHVLQVFDAPDSSLVVGQRAVTTVAPQAMFLMNDSFVLDQVKAVAKRVMSFHGNDSERVSHVYRLILGREPTSAEREKILNYVAQENNEWLDVCHVLMASAEFRTLY